VVGAGGHHFLVGHFQHSDSVLQRFLVLTVLPLLVEVRSLWLCHEDCLRNFQHEFHIGCRVVPVGMVTVVVGLGCLLGLRLAVLDEGDNSLREVGFPLGVSLLKVGLRLVVGGKAFLTLCECLTQGRDENAHLHLDADVLVGHLVSLLPTGLVMSAHAQYHSLDRLPKVIYYSPAFGLPVFGVEPRLFADSRGASAPKSGWRGVGGW